MRKRFSLIPILSLAAGLLLAACSSPISAPATIPAQSDNADFRGLTAQSVQANGALAVKGNRIVNASGQAIQLKGMSFFWSQWSDKFWNAAAVKELVAGWNCQIVRLAMGVESGGYLTNPAAEKAKIKTVVDAAIAQGIYVVIDWHDHNATQHTAESKAFFTEMAQTYGKSPNVMFEIYNEPDGESWSEIKAYAQTIIGAIRAAGSTNIVIVGTPTWSQDVDQAANDPITGYSNIAYTLHYYAATHKQALRDKAAYALTKGIALMVTEFGTCEATGDGLVDKVESKAWFDFLDANKISWMNWSLFDKAEAASALKPNSSGTGPWTDADLTVSGALVKAAMGGSGPQPTSGFAVKNGKLVDAASGQPFIMQGINHAHTWYKDKTAKAITDIRAANANTVRVVLSNGARWSKDDLATVNSIIAQDKAAKLVSVLEVHDTTGYGEDAAACSLDSAANYWVEMKSALIGQEAYVIVNIGNEPYGNGSTASWTADTKAAIQKLRAAGIRNTILVDAPNWGQDWSNTMKSNAAGLFAADPDRNLVFSIHMYGIYNTADKARAYLQAFASAGLPLIVGEFANFHSGTTIDAAGIMSAAKSLGGGYLAWSWSGNGGADAPLDMVNGFNAASPSDWGKLVLNDLKSAVTCPVFGGGPVNQPPTVQITAPGAGTVVNASTAITVSASASDPDGSVAKVAFYAGAALIAEDSSAPYSVSWTAPAAAGGLSLRAVATDNQGASAEASVNVTVKSGDNPGTVKFAYSKNDWGSGFSGYLKITNSGSAPISNWKVGFSFAGNQTITNYWSGKFTQTGKLVSVTPESWNGTIGAGATVEVGFNANYSGVNADPVDFALSF